MPRDHSAQARRTFPAALRSGAVTIFADPGGFFPTLRPCLLSSSASLSESTCCKRDDAERHETGRGDAAETKGLLEHDSADDGAEDQAAFTQGGERRQGQHLCRREERQIARNRQHT